MRRTPHQPEADAFELATVFVPDGSLRILHKYGYPPAAVQNVLLQAEALSAEWAS